MDIFQERSCYDVNAENQTVLTWQIPAVDVSISVSRLSRAAGRGRSSQDKGEKGLCKFYVSKGGRCVPHVILYDSRSVFVSDITERLVLCRRSSVCPILISLLDELRQVVEMVIHVDFVMNLLD